MKILVAPLDWGLGHATRCVPIVREFLRAGAEVELAVVTANAKFFREVFPNLRQRLAPSYNIVYPKHGYNMGLWLLKNSLHLNAVMKYEHHFAEEMVERHGYDVLFSDNRFAFYSKNAYSIYMTHQRRIAFPQAFSAFEGVGTVWHANVMRKFDEVWVPDLEFFPGYAGSLSHTGAAPSDKTMRFVGPLSRFSECMPVESLEAEVIDFEKIAEKTARYKVVAIVSGVEPARTQFEQQLRHALFEIPGRHLMILGKPSVERKRWKEKNIEFQTHMPTAEFADAVRRADFVVSRGGYSTVMDMAELGAKCIFVPTPGQFEQIVLAHDLSESGFAAYIPAEKLSARTLTKAFESCENFPCLSKQNLLQKAVREVIKKVKER